MLQMKNDKINSVKLASPGAEEIHLFNSDTSSNTKIKGSERAGGNSRSGRIASSSPTRTATNSSKTERSRKPNRRAAGPRGKKKAAARDAIDDMEEELNNF